MTRTAWAMGYTKLPLGRIDLSEELNRQVEAAGGNAVVGLTVQAPAPWPAWAWDGFTPVDESPALGVILVGYWAAFARYPLPPADFDYETVGVPNDWPHLMTGFEAHWNKNTNLAHHFDVWFLNLLPRPEPFKYHGGDYHTLSFIPTLGTMIMGLLAGGILRGSRHSLIKVGLLLVMGGAFLAAGYGLEMGGLCPLVKRIWTPSWALYSGGWCFIILAALFVLIDLLPLRWLGFPFIVIGMNSIAIYCMSWMMKGYVLDNVERHFGHSWLALFDERFHPLIEGCLIVGVFWLILYWLYRQKAFLRI